MRIVTDTDRCVGAGQCVFTDSAIFDQDEEDGTVRLLVDHVEGEQLERAREAVHICPGQALSLTEK
ncbi:ferredoxin [Amycolatopsis anabasis]|uniref:ferredoxin n=1 Tax=Amycolatopsis anabasis TaxID=1840409 RepID=UPI00131BA3DE|nr:ferredoxin [Amycolatopsis anabasis]